MLASTADANVPAPTVHTGWSAAHEERARCFDCAGERLVGICALPNASARDTGVLIVVGGPQYRAGSHRHFVSLARALADRGWPTMRFDARGMGDSSGTLRGFEQLGLDIAAAISAFFYAAPGMRRVVLWGLCDAASAALLYVDEHTDPRVAGLVLLNPWVRSEQTYARAQVRQYYARRLLSKDLWSALVRGRVTAASFADFARAISRAAGRAPTAAPNVAVLPYQARMSRGWQRFTGPTLLVLSGRDLTAREFEERLACDSELARARNCTRVTTQRLGDADHTLSQAKEAAAHLERLCEWLHTVTAAERLT